MSSFDIHIVFSIYIHTIFFEWIDALSKKYNEFYGLGKIVYIVSLGAEKLLEMLNGPAVTAYSSCSYCSGRDMQNIRLVRDLRGKKRKGKGERKRKGKSGKEKGKVNEKEGDT